MYDVVFCYRKVGRKLNFRIGGRKPPGHNPWFRTLLTGGSKPGGYVRGFTSANPDLKQNVERESPVEPRLTQVAWKDGR